MLTVNTLAAAEFLLTHAAKPDRGNGLLRFVYCAAGYLDMTKLLSGTFAVNLVSAAARRTKPRLVGRRRSTSSRLGMSGTPAWPAVEMERLAMDQQDADGQRSSS